MHSAVITNRLIEYCVKGLPVNQYSRASYRMLPQNLEIMLDHIPLTYSPPEGYDPVIPHAAKV